jgi:RNA polymerase sigma factor (sigma-70 family)
MELLELTAPPPKDELIERCLQGDTLSYKALYERYSKAMYNTCCRMLGKNGEAEDTLQETFIEAFKNLDSFEYRSTFGAWLKKICINKCINQLKKRKEKFVEIDEGHQNYSVEDEAEDPELGLKVEQVKMAMAKMPDGYRTVLNLYLFEGYDHEEIASILEVAESTARTQYMRAKHKLIEQLNHT